MVKTYILVVCYLEILDRLENGRLVPYKSGPGKGGVLWSQRGSFGSCPGRFWRAWQGGRQTQMDGRHQGLAGLSLELLVARYPRQFLSVGCDFSGRIGTALVCLRRDGVSGYSRLCWSWWLSLHSYMFSKRWSMKPFSWMDTVRNWWIPENAVSCPPPRRRPTLCIFQLIWRFYGKEGCIVAYSSL